MHSAAKADPRHACGGVAPLRILLHAPQNYGLDVAVYAGIQLPWAHGFVVDDVQDYVEHVRPLEGCDAGDELVEDNSEGE